jgi:hypothetical protein
MRRAKGASSAREATSWSKGLGEGKRAMSVLVKVVDELANGDSTGELTLEFLTERITVRELIRSRVYQEVQEYNARQSGLFRGLVQPTDAEQVLNGYRLRPGRKINWEHQFEKAVRAFQGNGVIVIVDDRQLEELDQVIELRPESKVSFLRLVPLIGG